MAMSDHEGVINVTINATFIADFTTSANWNSVRTVTVTGVADNLSDGDQTTRLC